jgi:hypothetical protein
MGAVGGMGILRGGCGGGGSRRCIGTWPGIGGICMLCGGTPGAPGARCAKLCPASNPYFSFTAALTFAFSSGLPCWLTRAFAFWAWLLSSIGYRRPGSAKDFSGSLLRSLEVS